MTKRQNFKPGWIDTVHDLVTLSGCFELSNDLLAQSKKSWMALSSASVLQSVPVIPVSQKWTVEDETDLENKNVTSPRFEHVSSES